MPPHALPMRRRKGRDSTSVWNRAELRMPLLGGTAESRLDDAIRYYNTRPHGIAASAIPKDTSPTELALDDAVRADIESIRVVGCD